MARLQRGRKVPSDFDFSYRENAEEVYNDLVAWIKRGRSKIGRPFANNTRVRIVEDAVFLEYHFTDVVKIYRDKIILTTGGWYTITTKARISWILDMLGIGIYSQRGRWYLTFGEDWENRDSNRVPYYDGIEVPGCFTDREVQCRKRR